MEHVEKTCEGCQHFSLIEEEGMVGSGEQGECRAHPPQITGDDSSSYGTWPVIGKDEWCGEWEPIRPHGVVQAEC